MFEYFPGNYVWNLSLNLALSTGAAIGEVDAACRPLLEEDRSVDDTERFFATWCAVADRLVELADADDMAGRRYSAATRLRRASVYYLTAERMQKHGFDRRNAAYQAGLDVFRRAIKLGEENCEFVEIPYGDPTDRHTIPGLLVRAQSDERSCPALVMLNGLDSTKEMLYGTGFAQENARRGVTTLIVDQPGTGESLRLRGLTGIAESERYAGSAYDLLAVREDIDDKRIAVGGWSLGGYFAPRAAACDPRFAACIAWGAIYDWAELQRRRLEQQNLGTAAEISVPHYLEHILWVFGQQTVEDFRAFATTMTTAAVSDQIRVPFLVVHGENDRQVPVEMAQRQYDAAVNSPRRELKIMTRLDGGVEHVAADNMTPTTTYIADWLADVLRLAATRRTG